MKRMYFFGGYAQQSHLIAERLGFKRGEYLVVTAAGQSNLRGMRGQTMYVVGEASERDDYERVIGEALINDFTVIYIDSEVMKIIEG